MRVSVTILGLDLLTVDIQTNTDPDEWHGDVKTELGFEVGLPEQGE